MIRAANADAIRAAADLVRRGALVAFPTEDRVRPRRRCDECRGRLRRSSP
jgi:hypothetical protein